MGTAAAIVRTKRPSRRHHPGNVVASPTATASGAQPSERRSRPPGKDKESNWLPAPDGPICLVMRLYWPKTEAPSILPAGEGSWKPPALAQAN